MNMKIYLSEDSPLVEDEMEMKGWRGDVLVLLAGIIYQIEFITKERLKNEIKYGIEKNNLYLIKKPVIVVDKIRNNILINTLLNMEKDEIKRFNNINLKKHYENSFPELQDINNWIRIY